MKSLKRIRFGICYLLCVLSVTSCLSQETKSVTDLRKSLERTSFHLLILLEEELIIACSDTIIATKFQKNLYAFTHYNQKTLGDTLERFVLLNILYNKVQAVKVADEKLKVSQSKLLSFLKGYEHLDFRVDQKLILGQVDGSRRSIVTGYDEGASGDSWFIFFFNDPILFKKAMVSNNKTRSWDRADLMLCNTFRENEIPLSLRKRMQESTIKRLKEFTINDKEIEVIIQKLKACDVTQNRYD